MHQQYQNRDILETLRASRASQLDTDHQRLRSVARAIAASRHKVEPVSHNFYRVVDNRTGRVKGWRQTHLAACRLASNLDAETA